MSKPPKRIYLGKYILLAVILLLVGAGTLYWYITAEKRDEVIICNILTQLAADLSKSEKESTATALLKVKGAADVFADPMEFAMDRYAVGSYNIDRLRSSIGRYRTIVSTAKVSASDITVEFISKERAKVFFSGKFSGQLKNQMSDTIIKDIEADFIKLNGKWLIKSMKFRNVLH